MAMSTRATKRLRISPSPPPPSVRSTPLDKLPTIVDLIVKYSPASSLLQLRRTSRALKDLADRRFPTHISIEADGMILAKTRRKQRVSWRPRIILPCLVRYVDLKPAAPDEYALTPCACDTGPHETHHVRFIAQHFENVEILRHADNSCTEPIIEAETCVVSCNGYERLATAIANNKSSHSQDPPDNDNITRNLGVSTTLSYAAIEFTKLVFAFKHRPFGMFPFQAIDFTRVPDHVNKVTILFVQDTTLSVDDLSFEADANYQHLTAGLVAYVCEELHRRKSPPKFTVIGANKWKRSWLPPDVVQSYPRAVSIETIFKDALEETLCQQFEYSERKAAKALKKVTFVDRVSYAKKNKEFEMESGGTRHRRG